jgi:hypothetical protein
LREACLLIGKSIVQYGATSGTTYSVLTTAYGSSSVQSHNDLANIYGDSPYYHLSSTSYSLVNSIVALSGTGFLKLTSGVASLDTTSYQTLNSILTSISSLSTSSTGTITLTNGVASLSTSSSGITGSGTTNYIPLWSSSSVLTNSGITDSGTLITFTRAASIYSGSTLLTTTAANTTGLSFTTASYSGCIGINFNIATGNSTTRAYGTYYTSGLGGTGSYYLLNGYLSYGLDIAMSYADNSIIGINITNSYGTGINITTAKNSAAKGISITNSAASKPFYFYTSSSDSMVKDLDLKSLSCFSEITSSPFSLMMKSVDSLNISLKLTKSSLYK